MKRFIIFGAGDYDGRLPSRSEAQDAVIIAADGGLTHCEKAGLTPEIAIGDFDSLGYVPGCKKLVLPVQKDVTDLWAAAEYAVSEGAEEILIYGGMGGRPDHTFANYSLLTSLAEKNIKAVMYGEGHSVRALCGASLTLNGRPGQTVSVFAFGSSARGVTLKGLLYPLEGATLEPDFPLGVSNGFVSGEAVISVTEGTLLIFKED